MLKMECFLKVEPLTADDFANGPLIGSTHYLCRDSINSIGEGFSLLDRSRRIFSHQSLFQKALRRCISFCQLTLTDDEITLTELDHQAKEISDPKVITAKLTPPSTLPVDNITELIEVMHQERTCMAEDCPTHVQLLPARLMIRNVVFLARDGRYGTVWCADCYDRRVETDPDLAKNVILDGRRLPPHAPVTIW